MASTGSWPVIGVSDRGSGSLLSMALVGGVTAMAALGIPLFVGLAVRQSVSGAADAAALAAADVISGLVPGYPCETARRVAEANGALLASCSTDGFAVTVSATRLFAGIPVTSRATAGPPPGGQD